MDLYRDVDSPVHRLHPSVKIVGLPLLFVAVLLTSAIVLWSLFLRGEESEADALPYVGTGVEYALAMGLRINFLLVVGIVLTACTRVEEFSLGLQRLGARPTRSSLPQPTVRTADVLTITMLVIIVAACLLVRFSGYGAVLPRI